MKKLINTIFLCIFALALAGCGKSNASGGSSAASKPGDFKSLAVGATTPPIPATEGEVKDLSKLIAQESTSSSVETPEEGCRQIISDASRPGAGPSVMSRVDHAGECTCTVTVQNEDVTWLQCKRVVYYGELTSHNSSGIKE